MVNRKGLLFTITLIFLLLWQTTAFGQNNSESAETNGPILDLIPLVVDGVKAEPNNMPFLLGSGRTVITLEALQNIIPFQSEKGPDGQIVILWEQSRIELYPGQNQIIINSVPQTLDVAPIVTVDGNYILPLRAMAEAMGYSIFYDAAGKTIYLCSPGYEPPPLPAPAEPLQPAQFDYSTLPTWGSISSVPGLADAWKSETIVAGYFTKLVNSPAGRTNNITLAVSKINGKVLQAGEVFSFNQTVGPRTAEAGYQDAKIFSGKKVITGIGGGVCQASSTIYNVALEANLQVLERYPHSLKVVYAPPNRDATVSWGSADLKFLNNTGFPIKILCKVEGGYVFAVFVKAQPEVTLANSTPDLTISKYSIPIFRQKYKEAGYSFNLPF